jgi:pimeloyl-ACP methyl ester carboxylesterase
MPEITGIHYRLYQGELSHSSPIIFVHGACMDARIWPKSLRSFATDPVLILDLPGHGQSQSVCKHSISSYSQLIFEFITKLGFRSSLLVGVGIGGSIIVDYTARHPDLVRGFIAINTAEAYFLPNKTLSCIRANQYLPAALEMLRKGMRLFNRPDVWDEITPIVQSQRPSVLAADLQLMHHYRCEHDWDAIASVPGLFLYGTGDRLIREIPTQLPGKLEARMIPGCSHWLPMENPDLIRREILSFLEVVPPASMAA